MKDLKDRLVDYLATLTGARPEIMPAGASSLPLFLRERYDLFTTRLFDRKFLLALEVDGWESGSPGEYGKQAELMRKTLGGAVVVVLPMLPSYARNRMVQMGIPFIVPGSQLFLPDSVIDLRETFPQPGLGKRPAFSPAAQCTSLYHLLRAPLGGISLKEIAAQVGYSQMMITKVKDEIEAAGACATVRNGRSVVLKFTARGRALWELLLPRFASPVKKTRWVRLLRPNHPALLAGLSALSRRTMINDDRLPTHALSLSAYQEALELGTCTGSHDADHANARVEVWSYPPERLSQDQTVDPLSLYLSLRNSADERVQQQLEELIQGVKW